MEICCCEWRAYDYSVMQKQNVMTVGGGGGNRFVTEWGAKNFKERGEKMEEKGKG